MKLTFFGLTLSSSWGNGHATPLRAIIKALHRQGHSITFFEREETYYAQHRDLPSPAYCDLRFYDDWLNIRPQALKAAWDSDAVITTSFLPDGGAILDELLAVNGPAHVYYDLDTPVTLSMLASGDQPEYVTAQHLPSFDLAFSFTGGRALEILEQKYGVRRAEALHGCVDPDVHLRVPPQWRLASDFSYMGTYSLDRQSKLESLFFDAARRLPKKKFLVVGSMFPEGMDWPMNVWYKPHLSPEHHPAFYSSCSATLNITRKVMADMGHCPSGRLFEAAACGTPIVSDYFAGMEEFFRSDQILTVNNTDEAEQAFTMSQGELRAMAMRARERTLDEHTGTVRARQMVEALERITAKAAAEAA